jgi:hypothetical protein
MSVGQRMMVVAVLGALGGCCCVSTTPVPPLPPAITVGEQARRLSEWSARLPRIKATTVMGGVRMDYRDDKGGEHTLGAEGLLQIRQHPEMATSQTPQGADVLLLGRSFDQPAFEAGRNATNWWFAVKVEQKEAWVGSATRPIDFATLGKADSANILRADLVPDLLALSPLPSTEVSPRGPILMMLVSDDTGTNELYYGQMSSDGRPVLSRQIIVDRRSGEVREVRMYDAEGVVAVRSVLSDYAPVTYAEGVAMSAQTPKFPRRVEVRYPGRYLTVALTFDEVEVPGEFKPVVFAMPDFGKMGLKVMEGD